MMNSIIFMWITIIVNILGWFILHILSKRRDLSNKKKEITIQYLIVICIVYQHITYPYIKNSSTNSNLVDYAI